MLFQACWQRHESLHFMFILFASIPVVVQGQWRGTQVDVIYAVICGIAEEHWIWEATMLIEALSKFPLSLREAVLVCLDCYNEVPWTGWLTNNSYVFLSVLEAGNLKPVFQPGLFLVRALFQLCSPTYSCIFMWWRGRERERRAL